MNKLFLLSLTALLGAFSTQAQASVVGFQWSEVMGGNGHYYQIVSDTLSWEDANAAAKSMNFTVGSDLYKGYLATVTSAAENQMITGLTFMGFGAFNQAWLGGKKDDAETWRWVGGPEAGMALAYANWSPGEPNNWQNREKYLVTNYGGVGGWNDLSNDSVAGYVVEYSRVSAVPLPAALPLFASGVAGLAYLRRRRGEPKAN